MQLQVRLARCSAWVYLNNLPLPICAALQQLQMLRVYIFVRLADKDMGIVLCDKAWYNDLCRAHLSDASKFVQVSAEQAAAACDDCAKQLQKWLEDHKGLIELAFGSKLGKVILGYLKHERDYELPVFYGIIKVHKPTPALRPIVAAHSWVTSPLAHVAAKNLQPDVVRTFPHILSSTPELVRDIEELTFTPSQVDSLDHW